MTAEEYREKEKITDANFWDGNEIDFNMIYEFAEEYHQAKLKEGEVKAPPHCTNCGSLATSRGNIISSECAITKCNK